MHHRPQVLNITIEAVYLGELQHCYLGPVDPSTNHEERPEDLMCTYVYVDDPIKNQTYEFPANT